MSNNAPCCCVDGQRGIPSTRAGVLKGALTCAYNTHIPIRISRIWPILPFPRPIALIIADFSLPTWAEYAQEVFQHGSDPGVRSRGTIQTIIYGRREILRQVVDNRGWAVFYHDGDFFITDAVQRVKIDPTLLDDIKACVNTVWLLGHNVCHHHRCERLRSEIDSKTLAYAQAWALPRPLN